MKLLVLVGAGLLASLMPPNGGRVTPAALDSSAATMRQTAQPSRQADPFTSPSILVDSRDSYDNDSMIVLLYRYGWAQTGIRLPAEVRARTLARLNNPKPDRGRSTLWIDVAPVKRFLSWVIIRLDDQTVAGVNNQALNERLAVLERRLAAAEATITDLKKRIR